MTYVDGDGRPHTVVEQHSKVFRDLMLGFARVHILHYAAINPVYGSGISAQLSDHGYRMSWGTLYPLLHDLSDGGFLAREDRVVGGKVRKYYSITPLGRQALAEGCQKAVELVAEITADAPGAHDLGRIGAP